MPSALAVKTFLALCALALLSAFARRARGARPSILPGATLGTAGLIWLGGWADRPGLALLALALAAGAMQWRRGEEVEFIRTAPRREVDHPGLYLGALCLHYLPWTALAVCLAWDFLATLSVREFLLFQFHVGGDALHAVTLGPLQKLAQLKARLAAFNARHIPAMGDYASHVTVLMVMFALGGQFLKGLVASYGSRPLRPAPEPQDYKGLGEALVFRGVLELPRSVLAVMLQSPYLCVLTLFFALLLRAPGTAALGATAYFGLLLCLGSAALEFALGRALAGARRAKLRERLTQALRDWSLILIPLAIYVGALRAGGAAALAGNEAAGAALYRDLCLVAYLFCLNDAVLVKKMYIPWRERALYRVSHPMLAAVLHNEDARELFRALEDHGWIDHRGVLRLEAVDALARGARQVELGPKFAIVREDVAALLLRVRGGEKRIERELHAITAVLAVGLLVTFRELLLRNWAELHYAQALAVAGVAALAGRWGRGARAGSRNSSIMKRE